jgi:hypothetical protein
VWPAGPGDELFAPRGNRIQISAKILNAMDVQLALRGHLFGRMANHSDLVPPSFADIMRLSQGAYRMEECSVQSLLRSCKQIISSGKSTGDKFFL